MDLGARECRERACGRKGRGKEWRKLGLFWFPLKKKKKRGENNIPRKGKGCCVCR